MKKLLIVLLLFALIPSAHAVQTDADFDYDLILSCAADHYGEVHMLVGSVLQVEEYHRGSDSTRVEEYTTVAVDDNPAHIVCVHYYRAKNQPRLTTGTQVAVFGRLDGVRRIDDAVVLFMESQSEPMLCEP